MIKRHKTLLLLGNFRSNLKGLWCQDGRTAHGPLSSFGGPSDVTLPASRGDGDLVGMLWYCCVSWGKHLLLSRPQFPHLSWQPRVKGEGRQFRGCALPKLFWACGTRPCGLTARPEGGSHPRARLTNFLLPPCLNSLGLSLLSFLLESAPSAGLQPV